MYYLGHRLLLLLSLLMLTACAKTSYLFHQGVRQVEIQLGAKSNDKLLRSDRITTEQKRKIRLIQAAKSYFSEYFGLKLSGIYDKTFILDQDAVSYLVIASPYSNIEPIKHWFPIVGSFPYLGFFKEEDALHHAKLEQKRSLHTYVRDVYAYSTLGYLRDPILSSFFHYSDDGLIELVFHELFHTIFFLSGEVDVNESLANYIGERLLAEYRGRGLAEMRERQVKAQKTRQMLTSYASQLKAKLKESPPVDAKASSVFIQEFVETVMWPALDAIDGPKNWYRGQWNTARFAAYLTYEDRASVWHQRFDSMGSVKLVWSELQRLRDAYKKSDSKTFLTFIVETK